MRAASSSSEMEDFNPRLYPLLLNSSIGGERLTAAAVQSTNPSNTNGVPALVPQGGEQEVNSADIAAEQAFPRWSTALPEVSADLLDPVGDAPVKRNNELGYFLSRE
jgi:acyl-CoA reductase-like NAD-dependent aldehyde dehydrogenase